MRVSGVELIDRALGGLAPGLPLVLAGASGSGRTVLALQLVGAAVGRGESAVLLTAVPPELLLRHAATLGLDLVPAVRERRLALLEVDAAAAANLRGYGPESFVASLRAEAPDARLIVIDPLTALITELLDEAPLRSLLRGVLGASLSASSSDADPADAPCVVMTAEEEVLRTSAFAERALGDLCGAFVRLVRESNGTRTLRVEKSRLGTPLAESVGFTIGERGIVVSEGVAAPQLDAPAPVSSRGLRGRPRVLVVEDDELVRRMMVEWLADSYEVSEAEDGFSALSQVLTEPPDVLVLDLVLPRVGGAELIAALARAGCTTPIVVVSGRMARAADRVRVLALGASDTLEKPVHKLELLRKVETLAALPRRTPGAHAALADAASLLEGPGTTRLLGAAAFAERLRRASRFGELADLPSSLLALEADTPEDLDVLIALADAALRTEDAILPVGETEALLLLVASSVEGCAPVLRRLSSRLAGSGLDPAHLRWRALAAATLEVPEAGAPTQGTWKPCFDGLAPWPAETPAA